MKEITMVITKERVRPEVRTIHWDWDMRIEDGTISLCRKTTDAEKAEYKFNEAMKVLDDEQN